MSIRPARQATMNDVAALAQVSKMTVSRVYRGDPGVAPKTRDRVLAAIEELKYSANETARAFRLGGLTDVIGLIVTNLANPFYSELALGVERAATSAGMQVMLGNSGNDRQRERELLMGFLARRAIGIVLVSEEKDHSFLEELNPSRIPIVFAARPAVNYPAASYLLDDFHGALDLTSTLTEAPANRIGFIGPTASWTTAERLRGFRAALEATGCHELESLITTSCQTIEQAEHAAYAMLRSELPAEAFFCANSRCTLGVVRAMRRSNVQVPIAGFDNFEMADMLGADLTLAVYDSQLLGLTAAEALIRQTGNGGLVADPSTVVLPTHRVTISGNAVTRP